jgi:glycerol-3-phosphate dehydrogenase
MHRDRTRLSESVFDLCVVGGGIYGASLAWEATSRGLSVALVEKSDFASGTSANSLKTIHGGFRYLQHADFKRMRESIRERRILMRIAPHLVHPLPVVIPLYQDDPWTRRKECLTMALALNDLIGFDRNRQSDPKKHIPRGHIISRRETLELLPALEEKGLNGGMVFYDAQVYNSERLVLCYLRSATELGAVPSNYVEATGLLRHGDTATGISARDALTGDNFEVRAHTVVNACGPWVNGALNSVHGRESFRQVPFSKAINLVTPPIFQKYAVGVSSQGRGRDRDTLDQNGDGLFFVSPWRSRSLVGTRYLPFSGDPEDFQVNEPEARALLDEFNRALPAAGLRIQDVSLVHGGLVPSSETVATPSGQRARHYQILDHRRDGLKGVISVVGVKYTTARDVAEKVIDLVFEMKGVKPTESLSSATPIYGGEIPRFEPFLQGEIEKKPWGLSEEVVRRLVFNYGTAYPQVLAHLDDAPGTPLDEVGNLDVVKAEVRHGVREELALRLSDVVFRRTELGSAGHPGAEVLKVCATVMAAELGWDGARTRREVQEVENRYLFSMTQSKIRA